MNRRDKEEEYRELKTTIHKMVDAILDKNILIKIYTFIKYLK